MHTRGPASFVASGAGAEYLASIQMTGGALRNGWAWFGLVLTVVFLAGCKLGGADEQCAEACKNVGECTYERGECVAKSNEDCAKSEACKLGFCVQKQGKCVADPCHKEAEVCKYEGRCTWTGGTCTAGTHEECKRSKVCELEGRCVMKLGACIKE